MVQQLHRSMLAQCSERAACAGYAATARWRCLCSHTTYTSCSSRSGSGRVWMTRPSRPSPSLNQIAFALIGNRNSHAGRRHALIQHRARQCRGLLHRAADR
jgi:hypothetical protein